MEKNINFIIKEIENNLRIDILISKREKLISRTRIKNLILKGKLKINNEIINNPSKKINTGDNITFKIPKPEVIALMYYDKTLSNIGDEFRPGIVHRIDKNTSGLIVIAKNNHVHESLSKQFSEHTILREYQLLVWGKLRPSWGNINTFINRSSKNRQLMEVSSLKGKRAITNYKTIEVFENDNIPSLSLVECKLETGRTHQIRVHMNYKGNSIVGDDKYKKKYKKFKNINLEIENLLTNLNRQFLHAKTIGFIHPKNNKKMVFSSNLPSELNNILKMLRNTNK